MDQDIFDRQVPEVGVDIQDAGEPIAPFGGVAFPEGLGELGDLGLVLRVALIQFEAWVDVRVQAAVVEMPVGVLEEGTKEFAVEPLLDHINPEHLAVHRHVGVGAAGGGDAGGPGDLPGQLLMDHAAVLGAVVQLEFREPMESLFRRLGGTDGEARARIIDLPETAVATLQLDRAMFQGLLAGLP